MAAPFRGPGPDTHARWFRRLLKLLPSDFRDAYGRDMERTFRAQQRDAARGGIFGVAALWLETIGDLLHTAPREHADQLRQDAGFALRMMRRAPGFTAVALTTLALGIGATSAMFSVVDAVVLQPLPYREPDRLVRLHGRHTGYGLLRNAVSPPNLLDWKQQSTVFSAIAGYRPRSVNLSGDGEPRYVQAARVSVEFFDVLGVSPMIGRSFTEAEDRADAKVVVLSHAVWQSQFGGDPSALGHSIDLDGEPFQVIGVMPVDFAYQLSAELFRSETFAELWLPLGVYPGARLPSRGSHNLAVVARLLDSVTLEEAQSEMSTIAVRLANEYPASNKGWDAFVEPLHESVVRDIRTIAMVLVAAVGFVLIIGCANIGGLLLARTTGRVRELGMRIALGASRSRLSRQLLTESLMLSAGGGVLGVCVAIVMVSALRTLDLPVTRLDEISVDQHVLVVIAGVSMLAGLLFGMAPAWHIGRWNLQARLRESGPSHSAGAERRAIQSLLSVVQVAIALILLAGAGVMVRTLVNLSGVDPGFSAAGVLAVDLSLSDARYPTTEQSVRFFQRVVDAATALPGVRSAAIISDPPLTGGDGYWEIGFDVVGRPPKPPGEGDYAYLRSVTSRYFDTLGIPLLRGRPFTESDVLGHPPVVLVNLAFARRHFADADPIGARLRIQAGGEAAHEIIGIVGDVRQTTLTSPAEPQMYTAYSGIGYGTLVVRSDSDATSLAAAVRAAIQSVDRHQPVHNVRRLADHVAASFARQRLTMVALAIFAGAALVLSVLGVYGVMAYAVRQRTQEIGVRVALGASRVTVVRMIVGESLRIAALGVVAGVAGAFVLTRVLRGLVYDVSPADPTTLALVVVALVVACALASLLPAVRATKVDPITVLRGD